MARKKQTSRTNLHARVDEHTPRKLSQLALSMGYKYGSGGAVGEFLDAIANSEIMLLPPNLGKVVGSSKNKG